MRLVRFGPRNREEPGLLDRNGVLRRLSGVVDDIAGDVLSPAGLARLAVLDPETLPAVDGSPRLGTCVGGIGKLICVGLNYADHAAEAGMPVPPEPILFGKATSSITGPNDDVILPPGSTRTDWEVELGIVIGSEARHVSEGDAMDHVAGYCIVNDVSERSHQIDRGGQWIKGKSADSFAPIGPWLVTRDEIPDPQDLGMWLEVDGERRQDGSTRTMIFGVRHLVHYISQFMSLQPGDVIPTGTPPGVGMGMKPPCYLSAGQVMRLGIEGLGEQQQRVVAAA